VVLDKDVVAELLAYEAVTGPTVTVYIYEDAKCGEGVNSSHSSFSVAHGNCEVGWNFTCSCDGDYRQVIAQKRWPACDDADAVRTYKLKADKCYSPDSKSGLVGSHYWQVDASQCPECCTDPKRCTVHGDPHITVFDQAKVTLLLMPPVDLLEGNATSGVNSSNAKDPSDAQGVAEVENQFRWGDFWLVKRAGPRPGSLPQSQVCRCQTPQPHLPHSRCRWWAVPSRQQICGRAEVGGDHLDFRRWPSHAHV